jgi:hypothetical protein
MLSMSVPPDLVLESGRLGQQATVASRQYHSVNRLVDRLVDRLVVGLHLPLLGQLALKRLKC